MRILLFKRKWWTAAACLCLALAMLCVVNYPVAVGASAATRQLPIYCVQRDQKMVSISFDAAWGNEDTQQLIDIMEKYQVKATFFVVGDWVDRYPESVKALHDAGHEIMNHSNTHAHLPQLSTQAIMDDLNACNDKIEAITGVRPTLIRPPYGDYDDNSIRAIRSMGMEPIQWDVDSLDWKDLSAADITRRVTSKVGPGSIVLFHNAAKHTPEALSGVIERLLQEGYTFVPISQIILTGDYTIDHTGKQCPA
ncbi:MAG: polysaccharide deacetylase family protein [Oscillospiraceae bacterium]|nr:polysaccharide deacetylase family protein [Oscillospiraceae bacterium]